MILVAYRQSRYVSGALHASTLPRTFRLFTSVGLVTQRPYLITFSHSKIPTSLAPDCLGDNAIPYMHSIVTPVGIPDTRMIQASVYALCVSVDTSASFASYNSPSDSTSPASTYRRRSANARIWRRHHHRYRSYSLRLPISCSLLPGSLHPPQNPPS